MAIPKTEMVLAGYVALRLDDWTPDMYCPAWVESRDTTCKRALVPGTALCKRHRTVAVVRRDKALAARQYQAERRAQYRAKMLPEWEAELAQVEADMERYGGALTTDRAAYGGESHKSIQRHQMAQLSDTNVQRMARLSKRHQRLTELIGNDG